MEWATNSNQESRAQRFTSKSDLDALYKKLTKERQNEVAQAIRDGTIDDPSARRTLDRAIDIIGTCLDFCSYYEKVERHLRNEVKRPEMVPGTDNEPDYTRIVKAFARPNDINSTKLPSDIRPPHILKRTLDYLFHDLLPSAPSFISVQEFIFDRTRAVRQDFTIQGSPNAASLEMAVDCHERIARFHILSLHESKIRDPDEPETEPELRSAYSQTLDIAQLNKTLTTLMQYYDDARQTHTFPNEPEFRAYRLLLQLRDSDVSRRTQRTPFPVLSSPYTQSALDLRNLSQFPSPSNLSLLLKRISSNKTTFLMACVLSTHLGILRREALKVLAGGYLSMSTSGTKVQRLLGFEDLESAVAFVTECGVKIKLGDRKGEVLFILNKTVRNGISDVTPKDSKIQSPWLTAKRAGMSWADIIDGKSPPPGTTTSAPLPIPAPVSTFAHPPTTLGFGGRPVSSGFGVPLASSGFHPPPSSFTAPPKPQATFGVPNPGSGPHPSSAGFGFPPSVGFGKQPPTSQPFNPFAMAPPPNPAPKPRRPSLSVNTGSSGSGSGITTLRPDAKEFVPRFGVVGPAHEVKKAPEPEKEVQKPLASEVQRRPSNEVQRRTSTDSQRRPSADIQKPLPLEVPKPQLTPKPKVEWPPSPEDERAKEEEDRRNEALAQATLGMMVSSYAAVRIAEVFAAEWDRRAVLRPVLRSWVRRAGVAKARRLEKEEERRVKEGRWGRLMDTLSESPPKSKKGKEKEKEREKPLPMTTVEEMQKVVEKATKEREIMWAPDVFLEAVRGAAMGAPEDWGVWISGEWGATSQWLDVKFGIKSGEGEALRSVGLDGERRTTAPGLLVFELSPTLATLNGDHRDRAWTSELQRLVALISRLPRNRPYRTAIVFLLWGDASKDLSAQHSDAMTRTTDYLQTNFPIQTFNAGVVVFSDTSQYHQAFQNTISRIPLDLVGRFVRRFKFQELLLPFFSVWDETVSVGLTTCDGPKVASQSVRWASLGRFFGLATGLLGDIEWHACDILGLIVEEQMPTFATDAISDEESFRLAVMQYLHEDAFALDVLVVGLRGELEVSSMRDQDLPVRRILDQLSWHVHVRLTSLGNDVIGDGWKAAVETFKIEVRHKMDGLGAFIESQSKHVEVESRALKKKRNRAASGEKSSPIPKKTKAQPQQTLITSSASVRPSTYQYSAEMTKNATIEPMQVTLKGDMVELERLIAESEAMLA